jgi:hypothetical protein
MVKCPYCKKTFDTQNIVVNILKTGGMMVPMHVFTCPQCEVILQIVPRL